MPTNHPRIGVTCDPELERALRRARSKLPPEARRSRAAQVRALALIGAAHVGDPEPEIEDDREWLRRVHNARLGSGDLQGILDSIPPGPPTRDLSEALEWVKGDR